MLEIEYKGANTVVLSTKKATAVIDPKLSVVGLKDVVVKGAIEIATEERFALNSEGARLHIEGPGEYGVADFDISGVAAQRHLDSEQDPKKSTMYRIESSGIRIAVVGNIYEKISEEQLEALGVVDILIVPVGGGGYTLDDVGAATVTRQVDPKVVIPVHYADDALKYEVPQADLDDFVKQLSVPVEDMAKLKLKSGASLPATLTVYNLARS